MLKLFLKSISYFLISKRKRKARLFTYLVLSSAWIFACTVGQSPQSPQPTNVLGTESIPDTPQPEPTEFKMLQPEWIYQEIPEKNDSGITFEEMVLFDGRLWLATVDGVVSIDTKTYESKHYRLEEGLADDVVHTLAVCELPEIMLLAGTRSGFSVYLPDQDKWDYWAEDNPMSYEEVLEIDCSPQSNKMMMVQYLDPNVQIFDAENNIWITFRNLYTLDHIAFYRTDMILMESGNTSKILILWKHFLAEDGNIDMKKISDLFYTSDAQFVISDRNQPDIGWKKNIDFAIFSMKSDELKSMEDFARMLSRVIENSFIPTFPVYFYDRDLGELYLAGESKPSAEITEVMKLVMESTDVTKTFPTKSNLLFGYLNYPKSGTHKIVPGDPYGVLFSYTDSSQSDRPKFKSEASVTGPDGTIWSGGATGDLMFSHFSPEGWTVYSQGEIEGFSGAWYSPQALTITEDGILYGMTLQGKVFQFDPFTKQYRGLEDFDEGITPAGDAHIVVDQDGTVYYSTSYGILVIRQ